MGAPFKISLLSDVRSFLKGTDDVEKALDDVASSLDELAADTEADAKKAADALETKFTSALKEVGTEAKSTGKKLGDDVKDGAKRAGDGIGNMKDESKQSIRETAASFGDITDGLDLIQEVAANAFVGFGPAGMAAGALAAIGIGLLKTSLDDSKEKADEFIDKVHEMSAALRETGGVAGTIADSMDDIVDQKEWFEFWQKLPIDRLQLMKQGVDEVGVSWSDVLVAAGGDLEAYDRVVNTTLKNQTEANMDWTNSFLHSVKEQGTAVDEAKRRNEIYAESGIEANRKMEEAQEHAKDVSKDWAASLSDHLNVAGEGLDKFVKDGKLNLDDWAKEVRSRAKDVATVEDFQVDVFPKLSPEAQEEFAKLPVETQTQIAAAYKKGSKGDKSKIETTLEAQVKVNPKVDEKGIDPVSIPATVDYSTVPADVAKASAAGQTAANRDGNTIEIKTKIDHADLQRQVNRAAASITPPTVYVNVKTKKEVP